MWTASKSAFLSTIVTRLAIAMIVILAVTAPHWAKSYIALAGKAPAFFPPMLATLYTSCVPALIALIGLDRLLGSIRRGEVFIPLNVVRLRIISWCSFAFALIYALSGIYNVSFLFAAFAAGFIGLILRVVKNVVEQAVLLKQENDLTV